MPCTETLARFTANDACPANTPGQHDLDCSRFQSAAGERCFCFPKTTSISQCPPNTAMASGFANTSVRDTRLNCRCGSRHSVMPAPCSGSSCTRTGQERGIQRVGLDLLDHFARAQATRKYTNSVRTLFYGLLDC